MSNAKGNLYDDTEDDVVYDGEFGPETEDKDYMGFDTDDEDYGKFEASGDGVPPKATNSNSGFPEPGEVDGQFETSNFATDFELDQSEDGDMQVVEYDPTKPEVLTPELDDTEPDDEEETEASPKTKIAGLPDWIDDFWGERWFVAALLGGAIVGFLIIVIVIIFICHAVRKKDEGSYIIEKKYNDYKFGENTQNTGGSTEYYA